VITGGAHAGFFLALPCREPPAFGAGLDEVLRPLGQGRRHAGPDHSGPQYPGGTGGVATRLRHRSWLPSPLPPRLIRTRR
jgi:hypothetical protein